MGAIIGAIGLVGFIFGGGYLIYAFLKKRNKKNPLIVMLISFLLFVFGVVITPSSNPIDTTSSYLEYANKSALPTDVEKVIIDNDKMIFEFDYDSKFGDYMKTLREIDNVDKRMKTFFKENKVKEVQLKSSAGDILLSSGYGVKFIILEE